MRIGIDARELCGHATGAGRYLSGLLRQWGADDAIRRHEFVLYAPERLDAELDSHRFATRLVEAADPYYASALGGIGALPLRSAWSVATARDVYRAIGHEVKRRGSHAWDARVSTTTLDKLWFVARGAAVALAARTLPEGSRDARLWQRPHDGTH